MASKFAPARLQQPSEALESRCCFCYGLLDSDICLLANQQMVHKNCLSPMLKALEHPDLELVLPDGETEIIRGYQRLQLWPV